MTSLDLATSLRARIFAIAGLSLVGCGGADDGISEVAVVTADVTPPPSSTAEPSPTVERTAEPVETSRKATRPAWKSGMLYCTATGLRTPPETLGCQEDVDVDAFAGLDVPGGVYGFGFDLEGTKGERGKVSNACCYRPYRPTRGRPVRERGAAREPVVADATPRSDWSDADRIARCEDERLAASWARDAALEHASAAEFARFALGLMALGAPADLVARALEAARDEVEHARIAYGFASAHAGKDLGPAKLPLTDADAAPTKDLVELVLDTIADGCFGETAASLEAAREAELATDATMRAKLDTIAADEARHAELAFAVVRWGLSVATPEQRRAICEQATSWLEDTTTNADFEGGRMPAAEVARIHSSAHAAIVRPALRALLAA